MRAFPPLPVIILFPETGRSFITSAKDQRLSWDNGAIRGSKVLTTPYVTSCNANSVAYTDFATLQLVDFDLAAFRQLDADRGRL